MLTGRSDSWFVPLSALVVVAVSAWLGVVLTNPDAPVETSLAAAAAGGFALLVGLVLAAPIAMFTTAFALLAFGTVSIWLFERSNPATLGPMPPALQWVNAFFMAVQPRTAGYNSVDMAGLTDAQKRDLVAYLRTL